MKHNIGRYHRGIGGKRKEINMPQDCPNPPQDNYEYVLEIIQNYSPEEARRRINGFLVRDTKHVDTVRNLETRIKELEKHTHSISPRDIRLD